MVGFAVNRAGVETGETSPTKTACGTYRAVEYGSKYTSSQRNYPAMMKLLPARRSGRNNLRCRQKFSLVGRLIQNRFESRLSHCRVATSYEFYLKIISPFAGEIATCDSISADRRESVSLNDAIFEHAALLAEAELNDLFRRQIIREE